MESLCWTLSPSTTSQVSNTDTVAHQTFTGWNPAVSKSLSAGHFQPVSKYITDQTKTRYLVKIFFNSNYLDTIKSVNEGDVMLNFFDFTSKMHVQAGLVSYSDFH